MRGTYYLHTSGLVIVDNAWLPVHVAPHRAGTTVVQVWHAAGALKRFGADTLGGLEEPEATFLHRHYDYAIASGEAGREPWSRALRTPLERVLPLGTPRTDLFYDDEALAAAKARVLAAHPVLAGPDGRPLRADVPRPGPREGGLGRSRCRVRFGRACRRPTSLVLKSHPNLDPAGLATAGFDVVADPASDMNDWLAAADILVTDYSSSIYEWALLRRPLVLLVDDLEAYERDPGLYLDYRTEMIGVQVRDTAGVAAAIAAGAWDLDAYEAFVARNLGACDGRSRDRIVERFIPARGGPTGPGPGSAH